MSSRAASIRVEVQPLPHLPSYRSGESSTSNSLPEEIAYATTALFEKLPQSEDNLYIVVEWPEERRLAGKGTRRNLVIQLRSAPSELRHDPTKVMLYVPFHLLPRYLDITTRASLRIHRPVELSQAILQPIISCVNADLQLDDLRLQDLLSGGLDSRAAHDNGHNSNGHTNGQRSAEPTSYRILREGHNILLDTKSGSPSLPFRIMMLEPVAQGYLSPTTKIIVSEVLFDPADQDEEGWLEGSTYEASSHGKTNLSMADFDPDAFLSSSLGFASHAHSNGPDIDGDIDQSESSASGSITPRPPGTAFVPSSPPVDPLQLEDLDGLDSDGAGTRFSAVQSIGVSGEDENVCWVSVGGLGRAGIFEGDWVLLRSAAISPASERLARVLAWERLDEDVDDLPSNPIIVPPDLHRALFPTHAQQNEIILQPTSFGARIPTLPTSSNISICRVATTEGVDKRFEKSWVTGLKSHFTGRLASADNGSSNARLLKRGDIFAVPVRMDESTVLDDGENETDSDDDDEVEEAAGHEDDRNTRRTPEPFDGVVYFKVTAINYEPLVALEEDFRSSASSKARAGELGCWIDVGERGETQMVLEGVERDRIANRSAEKEWFRIPSTYRPFSQPASMRLRDLLGACLPIGESSRLLQLSILVKGARGAGKRSLIQAIADEIGLNVITVDCYAIIGESQAVIEGILQANVEKAKSAAPSILLLDHIEALAKRSDSAATGKSPPIVKVVDDLLVAMQKACVEIDWPIILMGTTIDEDSVPGELLSCFKQDIQIAAPNEKERLQIVRGAFKDCALAPDVNLKSIATQTAALQAGDIHSLALRARDMSLRRAQKASLPIQIIIDAGLSINSVDINTALNDARSSYSDSIGAPKIPNVSWDDIGGLQHVKDDILDTIQLPLQHPELFAQGLKKRSGILLYGPPGTGKTLLAKAVATSCSLNFFSVKGPELLNMYIGESEANVRRVFQRARDASPCVVFMDELDSIAPKRGNQGDSGGVMDRIVSQLLAELDGMSSGGGNTQVYVLGATNRPDLLDPALLRPGRFDRMLYLSVATTDSEQLSILKALTRKFKLDPELDLAEISRMCPFNYTGADFYALCSDAMLKAMTRAADRVDEIVRKLNIESGEHKFPKPLTVQYYLASMASKADVEVRVGKEDFVEALQAMKPSVSESEMKHYERVQQEFKGFAVGANK